MVNECKLVNIKLRKKNELNIGIFIDLIACQWTFRLGRKICLFSGIIEYFAVSNYKFLKYEI